MAENRQVTDLPVVSTPDDGDIYIVKDGADARVRTGEALGLATLGVDGLLDVSQRPPGEGVAWGAVTGTLADQTDLQAELDAKEDVITTGSLIEGDGITLTGTLTDRLVGAGDVTVEVTDPGSDIPQVVVTTGKIFALTDRGTHQYFTGGSSVILTLPTNATVAFPIGTAITIVNHGTASVSIQKQTGVALYMATDTTNTIRTVEDYGVATLLKVATDTWFISGAGVS